MKRILEWSECENERDADGNLTDVALAINALIDMGCDCGDDSDPPCVACVIESALRSERNARLDIQSDLDAARDTIRQRHLVEESQREVIVLLKAELEAAKEDKATLQSIIDSMQTDLTRLRTDLDAARAENKIQAQMIEAMANHLSERLLVIEEEAMGATSIIALYREQAEQTKRTDVAGGGATDDGTPVKIEETEGK